MAVGKNKRLTKGKKGAKKRTADVFLRKEWYDVKTPSQFEVRNACKTLATKSTGLKMSDDSLKGRVFEANLADLNKDSEDMAHRKIQLECQEVQGRNCLTDFYGMGLTRDKQMFMIRKWHSLIEAHCKVKTTDGYYLRVFAQAFTMRTKDQVRTTCYAGANQIRQIRKKMVEIIQKESQCQMRELVKKLLPEALGKEMEKQCKGIFPLQNCMIRKIKMVKKPKFDLTKLMELHQNSGGDDYGVAVHAEADEAQNTLTADITEDKE